MYMRKLLTIIALCSSLSIIAAPLRPTLLTEMQRLQMLHAVHFVYDSSLPLNTAYTGPDLGTMPLGKALKALFAGQGISYKQHGHNIMLRRDAKSTPRTAAKPERRATFTIGGHITDTDGEPVINATIFDMTSKEGTLSDSRGRYLLHLAEGRHRLRATGIGCNADTLDITMHTDRLHDFRLSQSVELKEVVVTENMNSPVLTTQTGKRTFTAKDINNGFALLSSPDLVKTMQHTSGVASGVDLISGLYVHGGGSDENLFLLDGTPLYQTNHSLGLFSAFNSDIIKNVDFYKSGFPARYSGRISSITDVRTRDGNMERVHGTFSIGLLDGRVQVEGPISRSRTSFNVSLRRSWIDLLQKPAFAIINSNNDEKYSINYMFHDLNAKLTHHANSHTTLWTSLYSGYDNYGIGDKSYSGDNVDDTNNKLAWGNLNFTLGGDFQLSPTLSMSAMLNATFSHSRHKYSEEDYDIINSKGHRRNFLDLRTNNTRMFDIAAHADFNWQPTRNQHLHFGSSITRHLFHPQTIRQAFYYGDPSTGCDTTDVRSSVRVVSHEATVYAEDEMRLGNNLSANLGSSLTLTAVSRRTYFMVDPRFALKWQMAHTTSLKFSYTHMSQSIHRMASSFLELPTDFWVPTTDKIEPTLSHQFAAGIYAQPSGSLSFSLEAYYKRSSHLLQYRHWMGLQPSATTWDKDVADGIGKSYGIEADAKYSTAKTTVSLAYTLSWSRRLFKDIYKTWFDDQFDNRHKIDISLSYRFSHGISMYAAWTFHSGNRVTMPVGYTLQPNIPGDTNYSYDYIFDQPNNYRLPAYHRLDIGANFYSTTRSGKERVWNVSLYNAYCHLNTILLNNTSNTEFDFGDWNADFYKNIYNFTNATFAKGRATLHLYIDVWASFGYKSYRPHLIALSEEYNSMLRSLNDITNNDLGKYGLAFAYSTYTNVHGGYGCIGAYAETVGEWLK